MKKALSLLLAIVMVIGMLPMSALAAERKGGKITFETTFTEEMGVGDTFTVTATLSETPGIASFTNSLKWNPDVVEFNGFAKKKNGKPQTEVFASDCANVFNDETGIATSAADFDNEEEGILYVAEFTIIAEKGALGLGLVTTEHGAKFTFAAANGDDIDPEIDFSAIEGLTVGGKAVGPAMPEDAPFTAVTTNKGDAIEIQDEGEVEVSVWSAPHAATLYNVVVPAGATYADVTLTVPLTQMVTYNNGSLAGYYGPAGGGDGSGASFAIISSDDATTTIRIPMELELEGGDMSDGGTFSLVKNEEDDYYVAGPEYNGSWEAICYFSFEYAEEAGEVEEKYNITVDPNLVGGTIKATDEDGNEITKAAEGDYVFVTVTAAEGYTTNGAYYINGDIANDFMFQMPGKDVVLSANFTEAHTHDFKEVVNEDFRANDATCQHGTSYYKSCECGEVSEEIFYADDVVDHVYENGACKWCGAAEPVQNPGYTVTMGEDKEVTVGETVQIPVTIGHNNGGEKFNAYEMTFTYDPDALELLTKSSELTVENGKIIAVHFGDEQAVGTAALTLEFKTLTTGEATVTVTTPKIDLSANADEFDAPEAYITDGDTKVTATGYQVNLSEDFTSESNIVEPGDDFTFEALDKLYDYDVTAKIGDEEIEVTDNGDGTFTIPADEITGNVTVTAEKTGKYFDVTLDGAEQDKAQYMTDYEITLNKKDGYAYAPTVTIGGKDYTGFSYDATGLITIPGKDIKAAIAISSGEEEIPVTEYGVEFTGNGAADAEGASKAVANAPYSFKLNEAEGFDYTVSATMGGAAIELTKDNGTYTTPAATGNIVITIVKTEKSDLAVEVTEYVTLDGKTMFLVTATKTLAEGEVLKYAEGSMYWSNQYNAWAYLVITEGTLSEEEAAEQIVVAEADRVALDQTYDVNMTGLVDVNDAQLVYDMYNNVYQDFSVVSMQKFLNADVNGDKSIATADAAAIVSQIVAARKG